MPEDSAIVLVHIINPYGMAWLRRYNENNVDLNRNFLASGEEYSGAPDGYRELDSFLNPMTPPSQDFFYLKAAMLIARHGFASLKQSIAGGQYENPRRLFFGGNSLEERPRMLQDFVAERLAGAREVTVVRDVERCERCERCGTASQIECTTGLLVRKMLILLDFAR